MFCERLSGSTLRNGNAFLLKSYIKGIQNRAFSSFLPVDMINPEPDL